MGGSTRDVDAQGPGHGHVLSQWDNGLWLVVAATAQTFPK